MEIVLLKLLLAHLVGDFFLQPSHWVAEKERLKLKSIKLYQHVLLHIVLIFVVCWSLEIWRIALVIGFTHGIIDAIKLIFQREATKRRWFFIDQSLHLAVIFGCVIYYYPTPIDMGFLQQEKFWMLLVGAAFLTTPAAIFIKILITRWIPQSGGSSKVSSLQDAGKFIGILERLLVYLFICTGHFEAVGFLLAAKSIFRFGDLKDAHDLKLTEYVLIGTLLSFGTAIVIGVGVTKFL
jgi:hypothetical protein